MILSDSHQKAATQEHADIHPEEDDAKKLASQTKAYPKAAPDLRQGTILYGRQKVSCLGKTRGE